MSEEVIGRGIIEVEADASGMTAGIERAIRSVDQLEQATATAAGKASQALAGTGTAAAQSADRIDASTRRYLASLERESQQVGRSRAEYLELRAAKLGVADAAAPMIARIRDAEKVVAGVGISARQTAAAMRGVPAQLTDIAVSLQGGMNPLTVFLQQGGQLRDMFGGAAPAAKALGGAVLGLVNPFTVTAAAAGALALAYNQGSQEADAYARAVILTGNAAGVTIGQLHGMAAAIGDTVGTTGDAAEALAAMAETGQVGAGQLEQFAEIAVRFARTTGQAVSDTAKQFAELGKAPTEASRKLNEQYRYLTASVYEQIAALERQGNVTEAARVAQEAYAQAAGTRLGQLEARLGYIERGWLAVKDAAKGAWDFMAGIGRQETGAERLASLQQQLEQRLSQGPRRGTLRSGADNDKIVESLRTQIVELQRAEAASAAVAAQDRERAQITSAAIKAQDEVEKIRAASLTKQEQLNKALAEYRRNIEAIRKADPGSASLDPSRIARDEANIRARFADKSGGSGRSAAAEAARQRRETLDADISAIRTGYDQIVAVTRNSESLLEAQRAAGVVDEQAYYERKAAMLRANATAQEQALQQEIVRLQAERATGAEKIDLDRKIAEAQAKLATARASNASQAEVLEVRQQAALRSTARSFEEARQAAEDYLATLQRQQDRDLATRNLGPNARQRVEGENAILDRYQRQRDELGNNRTLLRMQGAWRDGESDALYEQQLRALQASQDEALAIYGRSTARRIQLDEQWTDGAVRSMATYVEEVQNLSTQTADLMTSTFRGLEDVFVNFTKTGKLSFSDLTNSILADLARIAIRQSITGPLAQALSGAISGFVGGASGGTPPSGGTTTFSDYPLIEPTFAKNGLPYVPRDDFPAVLHKGERVLTAEENRDYTAMAYRNYSRETGQSAAAPLSPAVTVNVINQTGTPASATAQRDGAGNLTVILRQLKEPVAGDIASGGTVARALEGTYQLGRGGGAPRRS